MKWHACTPALLHSLHHCSSPSLRGSAACLRSHASTRITTNSEQCLQKGLSSRFAMAYPKLERCKNRKPMSATETACSGHRRGRFKQVAGWLNSGMASAIPIRSIAIAQELQQPGAVPYAIRGYAPRVSAGRGASCGTARPSRSGSHPSRCPRSDIMACHGSVNHHTPYWPIYRNRRQWMGVRKSSPQLNICRTPCNTSTHFDMELKGDLVRKDV